MGTRSSLKRRFTTGAVLALLLVSSADALSHDDIRQPVVRFIDFYIAAQQPDVPEMGLLQRIVYGLAFAKSAEKPTPPSSSCR